MDWPYRWHVAQAHGSSSATAGELDTALELLDEAQRVYVKNPVPHLRPVEALKARVYLRQGRLIKAQNWAHERGLAVDDELNYLQEFEHLTLARLLVAEYQNDRVERFILEAVSLLKRLLKAAEEQKRIGNVLEILVTQALTHQAQGNKSQALAALERALTLAEPRATSAFLWTRAK